MHVADEVLAYLRTLVWPCVAVTALILFRRQLAALIPRIREVSAVGTSVRFSKQAFLDAYRELEAARDAGPAADVMAATPVPVIRGLASRRKVPQDAVRIAEELRRVRNEVAHGARLEAVDADNLAITARSLTAICRWAGQTQMSPAAGGPAPVTP